MLDNGLFFALRFLNKRYENKLTHRLEYIVFESVNRIHQARRWLK